MAIPFAKACAVITNLTLKLFVYHFSLNTAATPFNFPIVICDAMKMTHRFNYVIIIGGLNVGNFI